MKTGNKRFPFFLLMSNMLLPITYHRLTHFREYHALKRKIRDCLHFLRTNSRLVIAIQNTKYKYRYLIHLD